MTIQLRFPFHDELIVDNFAGGGGASLALEMALGRHVDIAINHDREAIGTHEMNHPRTYHYCEDVWDVDPVEATGGRSVAVAWFSPDCKHFSRAKGGKPVSNKVRGLAWVVIRWAKLVRPRVIFLENVEEFEEWGPLGQDGRPCDANRGVIFARWCERLRGLGYVVDWKSLRACDYGAPTIRKRLFLVARRDGRPIVWPERTHGGNGCAEHSLQPWATAADCIDWSVPCRSIFGRTRPLAEKTMERIARGIKRYVLEAAEPFIVTCNHGGHGFRGQAIGEPMRTITAARDAHGLVAAFLAQHFSGGYNGCGRSLADPTGTVTTRDHHAMVAAHVIRQFGNSTGAELSAPLGTVTAGGGGKTLLATSHLLKLRGTCRDGQRLDSPMPTVTAGGTHLGEVRAFLCKYYGSGGQHQDCRSPMHTIPTRDRFGLVTVAGEEYSIIDIGMRMLIPRELYRAQGFPDSYIIDRTRSGNLLSNASQVRMCGNSVSPPPAAALVAANCAMYGRATIQVAACG